MPTMTTSTLIAVKNAKTTNAKAGNFMRAVFATVKVMMVVVTALVAGLAENKTKFFVVITIY